MTNYNIGDKVTNASAFTSPIGAHFRAGSVFTVDLVGSVNIRLIADQCGSVVWLAEGSFLIAERDDLEELARRDRETRARIEADRVAALPVWAR